MSNSWHSYSSSFNLGHKAVADIFSVDVNIEEKVDGSQFSFARMPLIENGEVVGSELLIRSKGAVMYIDAPQPMFNHAARVVKEIGPQLQLGWTYRGEYLAKPKHNALAYNRIPNNHIIIFDINDGHESYLPYEAKKAEATRLGLECVPLLFSGRVHSAEELRQFLKLESVLGGVEIEGVVVKPRDYNLFGVDKKLLMGKFVSEAFKEVHKQAWGESNPKSGDILDRLGAQYGTQQRWMKAIQHLREAGKLENSPRDIGALLMEIPEDIKKECEEAIKEELFRWAWPHIRRLVSKGFPQYYKEKLLELQFEQQPDQADQEVGSGV